VDIYACLYVRSSSRLCPSISRLLPPFTAASQNTAPHISCPSFLTIPAFHFSYAYPSHVTTRIPVRRQQFLCGSSAIWSSGEITRHIHTRKQQYCVFLKFVVLKAAEPQSSDAYPRQSCSLPGSIWELRDSGSVSLSYIAAWSRRTI
jgi:hypothetical protein